MEQPTPTYAPNGKKMDLVGLGKKVLIAAIVLVVAIGALIVVGLFIGSSIVYYAGIKPVVFGIPIVGFMGYIVAFTLGCWIVLDILIKGRKKKH